MDKVSEEDDQKREGFEGEAEKKNEKKNSHINGEKVYVKPEPSCKSHEPGGNKGYSHPERRFKSIAGEEGSRKRKLHRKKHIYMASFPFQRRGSISEWFELNNAE
jgi:hypothetical protein